MEHEIRHEHNRPVEHHPAAALIFRVLGDRTILTGFLEGRSLEQQPRKSVFETVKALPDIEMTRLTNLLVGGLGHDHHFWTEERRTAAEELLQYVEFENLDKKSVTNTYNASINALPELRDPFIPASHLVNAGRIIMLGLHLDPGDLRTARSSWSATRKQLEAYPYSEVIVGKIKKFEKEIAKKEKVLIAERRQKITELYLEGKTNVQIKDELGLTIWTVKRDIDLLINRGELERRRTLPRTGEKYIYRGAIHYGTQKEQQGYGPQPKIEVVSLRERLVEMRKSRVRWTYEQIRDNILQETGIKISTQTINYYIGELIAEGKIKLEKDKHDIQYFNDRYVIMLLRQSGMTNQEIQETLEAAGRKINPTVIERHITALIEEKKIMPRKVYVKKRNYKPRRPSTKSLADRNLIMIMRNADMTYKEIQESFLKNGNLRISLDTIKWHVQGLIKAGKIKSKERSPGRVMPRRNKVLKLITEEHLTNVQIAKKLRAPLHSIQVIFNTG